MIILIIVEKALQNKKIVINADLIEYIEEIPETVIVLVSGRKIIVNETKEEIIKMVVEYKRSILIK